MVANKAEGYDRYEDSVKPELLWPGKTLYLFQQSITNLEELFETIIEKLEGKGYNLMYSTEEKTAVI